VNDKSRLGLKVFIIFIIAGILIYKFAAPELADQNKVNNGKTPALVAVKNDSSQLVSEPETPSPLESKESTKGEEQQKQIASTTPGIESDKGEAAPEQPADIKDDKQPVWRLFRSTTCIPCVEMQNTMDALKPEYEGKIKFESIDVNDPANEDLIRQYGIRYIPTTFLFDKNEKLFEQKVGAMSVADMRDKLNALLEVK